MLASRDQLSERWDCVVIGGGIVGAACTLRLAQHGLRCLTIEPGVIGGGATAAGMGHVVVMDDSEAQFALTTLSRTLWDRLAPSLPPAAGVRHRGTLWIAADSDEMNGAEAKHEFYRSRGVASELLSTAQLTAREPNLRSGLAGALLIPGDSVVYPPVVARWMLDQAALMGSRVWSETGVASITDDGVLLADKALIRARLIVNAAGIHAANLTPGLHIRPRKGHLVITDRSPDFCRHQLVELGYLKNAHSHDQDSVAFNVQPRETGQLLIGSSRQYDQEHGEIDDAMLARMLSRAVEHMPAIASLSAIRVWTGFRAATPDSLPIIGPAMRQPGVLVACGHEGLGITTSLGTAELLAAQVLGNTPPIPIGPYLPSRFDGSPNRE